MFTQKSTNTSATLWATYTFTNHTRQPGQGFIFEVLRRGWRYFVDLKLEEVVRKVLFMFDFLAFVRILLEFMRIYLGLSRIFRYNFEKCVPFSSS